MDRSRPYEKRERARQEEATRRRITRAAVELHGTVGPAATKVTDLARLAGVSRMTFYNHFPTERDLYQACSGHWASEHPFPDPSVWEAIPDPPARVARGLADLYPWFERNSTMLMNVFRDAPGIPALRQVMDETWSTYAARVVEILNRNWIVRRGERAAFAAVLRLAVDFFTWRMLTSSGLTSARAAVVATRMVAAASQRKSV